MLPIHDTRRAKRRRMILARYKQMRGCVDCGYKAHSAALEFDHVVGEKSRTVASLMYHSWEKIKEEISKCDVVCANCHAIRTEDRRNAGVAKR